MTTTEKLLPILTELEARRRHRSKRDLWILLGLFTTGLALVFSCYFAAENLKGPVTTLGIVVGIIVIAIGIFRILFAETHRRYCRTFRALVIPGLLQTHAPDLVHDRKLGISRTEFSRIRFFAKPPDEYRTGDLIEGSHNGVEMRMAFVHSWTLESVGSTTQILETQFRGAIVVLDFHKSFQGKTYVFPDRSESTLGRPGRALQKIEAPARTNLIQLECTDFEKDFAVFSTDEVESRYLLSPTIMDGLRQVRRRFGRGVRFCFRSSKLYIAIPSKGHFMNPKRNLPATEIRQLHVLERRLKSLLGIIDDLDQRTRIWSKR